MNLARTFAAFVLKESRHILRDTRTLVILFAMPVLLVFLFGYTVTNEFRDARVAIVDHAGDELSGELTRHLLASGHFDLAARPTTSDELDDLFEAGAIKLAVVLPAGFEQDYYRGGEAEVQLIADASEPNYATTLVNYATRMLRAFAAERGGGGGAATARFVVAVDERLEYNPQLESSYTFVPGVAALILMLVSALMTSLTIAREREFGTMNLLLVSPLPPLLIILGKVTPYAVLSFVDALLVFGIGHYVFAVPILGSLPLLLGVTILYLLVTLALGIAISARAKSQQVAMMVSLFSLLMPTMLLSGFLFPIASMPWPLQRVSSIIPATYFIRVEQALMLRGAGWAEVAASTGVLAGMAAVLLAVGLSRFQVRYR